MLFTWLERWRHDRAARRYGQRLPAQLQADYGAAEHYTAPQIARSAKQAGLSAKYVCIGQAVFLPEAEYQRLVAGQGGSPFSRDSLRAMFLRHAPPRPVTGNAGAATSDNLLAASQLRDI
jgi:hypothetical protein